MHDRVFVLHKRSRGRHASDMYKVSEYELDSSSLDLRRVRMIDSTLSARLLRLFVVHLFSSSGFVLVSGGNDEVDPEYQIQLTRLYDSSTDVCHSLAADVFSAGAR